MSKKNVTVDIVLPVFNEEQVIMENTKILLDFLKHNMKCKYGIIIANSGSKDKTLKKAKKLEKNNKYIKVINLKSHNCMLLSSKAIIARSVCLSTWRELYDKIFLHFFHFPYLTNTPLPVKIGHTI